MIGNVHTAHGAFFEVFEAMEVVKKYIKFLGVWIFKALYKWSVNRFGSLSFAHKI